VSQIEPWEADERVIEWQADVSRWIRYPLKVTKSMGAKRVARRSKIKPFIKVSAGSLFGLALLSRY